MGYNDIVDSIDRIFLYTTMIWLLLLEQRFTYTPELLKVSNKVRWLWDAVTGLQQLARYLLGHYSALFRIRKFSICIVVVFHKILKLFILSCERYGGVK